MVAEANPLRGLITASLVGTSRAKPPTMRNPGERTEVDGACCGQCSERIHSVYLINKLTAHAAAFPTH